MSRVDALRKELDELEIALPDARDYLEASIEIDFVKWRLESEEKILWQKWTSRAKSPA